MYWKRSIPSCNHNRCDEVALRTTCIKNVESKIIKIRTGCKYVGYCYYSGRLNCAACGPRVGHSWFRDTNCLHFKKKHQPDFVMSFDFVMSLYIPTTTQKNKVWGACFCNVVTYNLLLTLMKWTLTLHSL